MSHWGPNYQSWIKEAQYKGHVLETSEDFDGDVDMFVCDTVFHNGPRCTKCDNIWCVNCTPVDKIEPCPN